MTRNSLRVMTLNMWNSNHFRFERGHLLAEAIGLMQPHLVALQEVSILHDMAAWLVSRVNEWTIGQEYRVFPWNKIGPQGAFEGLAILTCLPTTGQSEAIDLQGGGRIAHRITVEFDDKQIAFCNTHLHHPGNCDTLRAEQARLLSEWMMTGESVPIVAGDFNATPDSAAIAQMLGQWTSAYGEQHGREPEFTFPTPIVSEKGDWYRPRTLDYILFRNTEMDLQHVSLCFTEEREGGEPLYASDHYGLIAEFTVKAHVNDD